MKFIGLSRHLYHFASRPPSLTEVLPWLSHVCGPREARHGIPSITVQGRSFDISEKKHSTYYRGTANIKSDIGVLFVDMRILSRRSKSSRQANPSLTLGCRKQYIRLPQAVRRYATINTSCTGASLETKQGNNLAWTRTTSASLGCPQLAKGSRLCILGRLSPDVQHQTSSHVVSPLASSESAHAFFSTPRRRD